jgi:Erv1 / Alr family
MTEDSVPYDSLHPAQYTEFWGPSAWRFLHAVSFTLDPDATQEDRERYRTFFNTLGYVLPCPHCRGHYNEYIKEHPVNVSSARALAKWVYTLHNSVNARTKEVSKEYQYTFEDIEKFYTGNELPKNTKNKPHREAMRELGNPFMERLTEGIDWPLFLLVLAFIMMFYWWWSTRRAANNQK